MRIDHINIAAPMPLLEKARDFYCKALLLEDGPRPDFGREYTVNHITDFNISQVFCHDPCGIGVEVNGSFRQT